MEEVVRDLIRIEVIRLSRTGMLIGVCSRLRGLVVHGRNIEEMQTRIPGAIEGILCRCGNDEVVVSKLEDNGTDDLSAVFTILRYEVVLKKRAVLH
jgi:hypothetical protein|nr:hypothetical protein [Neorhizobium tomejilense]